MPFPRTAPLIDAAQALGGPGRLALTRADLHLAATPLRIALIVTLAIVLRLLVHRVVRRLVHQVTTGTVPIVLRPRPGRSNEQPDGPPLVLSARRRQRAETLGSVLRSIASFTIVAISGAMVLSEVGLDLAPVVASAGIIGVAVGFGAQNLIKDFLTGMFMILEDQYGVGDLIDAGPAVGTVEAVGLRSTRLRDDQGTVWHIRNGEILRVGNMSQGWSRMVLDVALSWDTDLTRARTGAKTVLDAVWRDPAWAPLILEEPEVAGVQTLGTDTVELRLVIRTAPSAEAALAREVRLRLKHALDEAGLR